MGVYVKGMTTPLGWPRSCEYCTFNDHDWNDCSVLDRPVRRKDDCPLVPVKTPHGRLIDADALVNTVVFHTNISADIKEFIEDLIGIAPTVIDREVD